MWTRGKQRTAKQLLSDTKGHGSKGARLGTPPRPDRRAVGTHLRSVLRLRLKDSARRSPLSLATAHIPLYGHSAAVSIEGD